VSLLRSRTNASGLRFASVEGSRQQTS